MASEGPIAAASGLVAGYGPRPAIEDVDFAVHAGDRVAVLGPNGGGKTTLFRVLTGELEPGSGSVTAPDLVGTVPQTERSRLDYPVSALDVALMGSLDGLPWWRRPGRRERRRAREALSRVGLSELRDETFGELSGGQRQRVLIARALVSDSTLLLLDEPFNGLDSKAAEILSGLIDELAAEGRAVLIATHDLEQAREWDLVLCINRAQIAFGPPATELDRDVLERTYGAEIVEVPGEDGSSLGVLPPHHHDHDHGSDDRDAPRHG